MKFKPKQILFLTTLLTILMVACNRGCLLKIFQPKTQREAFAEKLRKIDTTLANRWLQAGEIALQNPMAAPSPYFETGRFYENDANTLQFAIKPGRKIKIEIFNPGSTKIFADLFFADSTGLHVLSEADTTKTSLEAESIFGGKYVVRLQAQPGYAEWYQLKLSTSPLLAWPVKPGVPASIGSYWGADRDGGQRSHQGIDIFAKKGSLLVAAADGYVTRVGENNLGGKVIFLRPYNLPVSLYYAHLDSQLVAEGTHVKTGDILGTVGNTGNARGTPPHLHFGVYTQRGAVNPLGYLQQAATPKITTESLPDVKKKIVSKKTRMYPMPDRETQPQLIQKGDTVIINSATGNFYRAQTVSGKQGYVIKKDL